MIARKIKKWTLNALLVATFLTAYNTSAKAPYIQRDYSELEPQEVYHHITENKKPINAKRLHPEILSYAGETDTLYVPEYSLTGRGVPATNCSRYARFTARDLFGLEYQVNPKTNRLDAWDVQYFNNVIETKKEGFSKNELEKMIEDKTLQPGMIIGIYNPKSKYKNGKDCKGNKRLYTHVGIFLGKDEYGRTKIGHQLGRETRIDSLQWFYDKNLTPVQVNGPKD